MVKVKRKEEDFKPINIILETPEELKAMKTIAGGIGGDPKTHTRKLANAIYEELPPIKPWSLTQVMQIYGSDEK